MSMSTHVVGFKPPDDKWKRMKEVYDACVKAKVKIPDEVLKFFEYEEPDSAGVQVRLQGTHCCVEFNRDSQQGIEIDVAKLPEGVKYIRFFNSF